MGNKTYEPSGVEKLYNLDRTLKKRFGHVYASTAIITFLGALTCSAKSEQEIHNCGLFVLLAAAYSVFAGFNVLSRDEKESQLERKLYKLKSEGKWPPHD